MIPIKKTQLGDSEVNAVSGRDLHAFLEVGSAFKDWITRGIEDFGFIEGQDFCSFLSESNGGRPAKEYAVSISMAKELAMVQRTAKGKQALRLGEMIAAQKETVGLNTGAQGVGKSALVDDEGTRKPTLADAGISKDLSSRAQKLAAVPEGGA